MKNCKGGPCMKSRGGEAIPVPGRADAFIFCSFKGGYRALLQIGSTTEYLQECLITALVYIVPIF
jgi:hypothetical protein